MYTAVATYIRGLPFYNSTYEPRGRWGGGVNSPIHFHCVLHTKKGGGGGFQVVCKIAYILNGRPLTIELPTIGPTMPPQPHGNATLMEKRLKPPTTNQAYTKDSDSK